MKKGNQIPSTEIAAYFFIFIACIFPFFSFLSGGYFLSDDYELLFISKDLKLSELVTTEFYRNFPWQFIRPIGLLSWKINYLLYGFEPGGYFLTNILLHSGTALIAAFFAKSVTKSLAAGFLAGMLFAVHPAHAEVIDFLSGRYDSLCALFYLSALFLYIKYTGPGRKIYLYIISIVFFTLAFYSKEMALTLPVSLIAYELFYGKENAADSATLKKKIIRIIPFFIILVIAVVLRMRVFHGIGGYSGGEGESLHTAIPSLMFLGSNLLSYLTTTIYGINRAYPSDFTVQAALITMAAVVGIAMAFYFKESRKASFFLLSLLFISFLPVINFSPVYGDLLGSRFMYLPSVFFVSIIGTGYANVFSNKKLLRPVAVTASICLFFSYYFLLNKNNEVWLEASRITYGIQKEFIKNFPEPPNEADIIFFNIPAKLLGSPVFFENANALNEALYFGYDCPDKWDVRSEFRLIDRPENINLDIFKAEGRRKMILFYNKFTEKLFLIGDTAK